MPSQEEPTTPSNEGTAVTPSITDVKEEEKPQPSLMRRLATIPEYSLKKDGSVLSGKALNWGITIVANVGFCSFGYDQGLFSALVTLDDFQRDVPLMAPYRENVPYCLEPGQCLGNPNTQAAGIAVYQVGCIFGAIAVLSWGDTWGRRSSTFWGCFLMIAGTVFHVAMTGSPATTYTLFVVGRIIGGLGNGCVTSTIPTWQSECAKPKQRGMIIILSGAMIALGIMISYWINVIFFYINAGSVRWRFPIAFQVSGQVYVYVKGVRSSRLTTPFSSSSFTLSASSPSLSWLVSSIFPIHRDGVVARTKKGVIKCDCSTCRLY